MSEFMRQAIPIFFMFGCVLGLLPVIAFAMWAAFDGDRLREAEETLAPDQMLDAEQAPAHLEAREALGAA